MREAVGSRLAQAMLPVLEKIAARSLSFEERALLEEILTDHGLEGASPPEWMLALFDDILASRGDKPACDVPTGYPGGENGLANILADIHSQFLALGVEDEGESVCWEIPSCGVTMFISRESGIPGYHKLQILPFPDPYPDRELLAAIARQDVGLARQLLALGANPNQGYQNQASPLILAIYQAPELVPDLLSHGADPNASSVCGSPLIVAAWRKDVRSLEHLLAKGAEPNLKLEEPVVCPKPATALFCALAGQESPEMIATLEKLLQAGASIRQENISESEIVRMAAQDNKYQIVKVLLRHGADATQLPDSLIEQLAQDPDPEICRLIAALKDK
ncbi:MAG: ankyrin repeat domain-containing protein [Candidatus Sericytochromatia bacterium]